MVYLLLKALLHEETLTNIYTIYMKLIQGYIQVFWVILTRWVLISFPFHAFVVENLRFSQTSLSQVSLFLEAITLI